MHTTDLRPLLPPEFRSKLTAAEEKLIKGAPLGQTAICGDTVPEDASDKSLSIRADLIRWLCLGEELSKAIDAGGLKIQGANIVGELNLAFGTLLFPLTFNRCQLSEDADLSYAKIPEVNLTGSSTQAIKLEGAEVKGDVCLAESFSAKKSISLDGAKIGGNLNCKRSTFAVSDKYALAAGKAEIAGTVSLGEGFSSTGQVRMSGMKIGGDLDCRNGSFHNHGQVALTAVDSEIRGNVFLNGNFVSEGEVQLERARIGENVECNGATFRNPRLPNAPRSGTALRLDGADIKGEIKLFGHFKSEGLMSLAGTTAGALADEEACWPEPGNLLLDGFIYSRFARGPTGADKRIRWLGLQPKLTPQPYLHLAKVLRETGDDAGAKQVLFELEKRQRGEDRQALLEGCAPAQDESEKKKCSPFSWLMHGTEDIVSETTIGYGIYPGWAVWYAGGLAALGWIVHRRAGRMGAMAPTDKDAYEDFRKGKTPEHYQPFNPLIYSIENCVPLVKLGQDDLWRADPNPQTRETPPAANKFKQRCDSMLDSLVPNWAVGPVSLRWFRWIMIALGWLLATFFLAGLTGIIRAG
jgi:hypothetical protein